MLNRVLRNLLALLPLLLVGLMGLTEWAEGAQSPPSKSATLFEEPLSPRIANYQIDVKLTPETRTLEGRQVLTWYNKTGETIDELRFHLYLNAFRNSRTTFMQESGGTMRGHAIDEGGWGFIEVDRLSLSQLEEQTDDRLRLYQPGVGAHWRDVFRINAAAAGADLTEAMEFIQPNDGNEHDKTVFRVPLPKPLTPGEGVALDFEFRAQLPTPPFARTGAKDEYFFVGQWFPKIAVHDRGEWNAHQFHYNSEFFADYGVYDVRMTVPKNFVLGATGLEVETIDNGDGSTTHYYHAEDVHDFAWTASPEYQVFTGETQDVKIRALVQPDHVGQGERHIEAAKVAPSFFQDNYGDYPFPNLTVVDPRRGVQGSGGMEYPTLITAGTGYNMPAGIRILEMVIIHEFGHNFWYHLLASNEFEEAWMDEGINTYTDGRAIDIHYEGYVVDFPGLKVPGEEMNRVMYISSPKADPVYLKAWKTYDRSSYGANSYAKPGLILKTLRNYLGPEKMNEAMRAYVERWRFKHPKTEDFIGVVNDVSRQDLIWYFDQAIYSNAVLDYSVASIQSEELKDDGYDLNKSVEEAWNPPKDNEEKNEDDDSGEGDEEQADTLYRNEIKIRRLGEFRFPTEIEIVFEDGETIREQWDGQEAWTKLTFVRPTKLTSATVDPDRNVPLDINYTNNSRTLEPQKLGITKVAARWMFWWQFILDLVSL